MNTDKVRQLRNFAGLLLLGLGVIATKDLSATNCYTCELNDYCREIEGDEIGQTTCVDPNQGWDHCTLGGDHCAIGED